LVPSDYLTSREKELIRKIRKKVKESKDREELKNYVIQLKLLHERIFIRYGHEKKFQER
jgi:hypothetical protein